MSKYFVDGKEYETSLKGLVIKSDSEKENLVFLCPTDKEWKRYFEADPEWTDPGYERGILLYSYENNLFEVEHVAYVTWKKGANVSDHGEIEVQLDPVDRAYMNGLLIQQRYYGDYDSVGFWN